MGLPTMNDLPRQTRNHSIDEPEPLPDLSAMPDPRGLQANSLQADTSLDNLLAPGRDMLVNEPQPLPGVLPPSDAQKSADDFREFYGSLPFGMRLGIAEQGGLPSLATHFMQQRQQAAAKMMELQDKQQQHVEDKILGVWQDHNMPLAQKKKVSEQYGRQYGSALGINLAKMAKDDLVSKSEIYQKYLPPGKYQELRQILQTPNADLAPVEHWAKWAEDRHKVNVESGAKSERFAQLLQQHQESPLDPHSPEFDELKQMVQERTKRQEEAVKLKMEIEGLGLGQKKTQVETNILATKPTEVYSARGPNGDIITGVYDPITGKTTEKTGAPLQKVENIIPTNMLKDRSEIRTSIDQLKSTADLFHPDFVGTLDTIKNSILRTMNVPITAKRKDAKTGEVKTVREEDFRFAYDMLQKVLRKTLMGTAQSAQELSANPLAFPSATDRDADVTVPAFLRGQYRNLVQQLDAQDKVLDERMRQQPMTFAMRYQQLKQMAATTDAAGRNALGFKSGEDMNAAIAERLAEEMQRGWIKQ